MAITLNLLGPPRAQRAGAAVELPVKAFALLGYLALADDPQPRERILGLLWGESTEEAARKNLRNTLWSIRKKLGENAILAPADRLTLGPEVEVDVARLAGPDLLSDPRRLLDLYAGPFLDGLTLADAPEFELWLMTARDRLEALFLSRMTDALAVLSRAEAWPEVAALARAALKHDPLHEALHRCLMEALARMGQRGEALRQFEVLKSGLAFELGVDPSPETTALRDAIATGSARPSDPPSAGPPRRLRTSNLPAQPPSSPFVGRAAEREALDQELALAAQGQARVVLITGELGIGKSRLWHEWSVGLASKSASAPGALQILEARCIEATSGLPFAPLVDLFASHRSIQELLREPSPVPPHWLSEVARLLPEIRAAIPDLPQPTALPAEEERRRLFEAFVQVLVALNGRPLLVFVDDVHWADRATLDWLPYLVHRMRNNPVLLALAYRPEEGPPALVRQAAVWAREGILRRLPLALLTPEETARLIGELHVDSSIAHQLQAQSAGNPYFLLELSRHGMAQDQTLAPIGVPSDLAHLLRSQVDRLDEDARAVLQAAAVLEPDIDSRLIMHVTGRDEDDVLDALDVLLAAGQLTERSGHFEFNHPLLSLVVREGLSSARWTVLNRRAGEALEAVHEQRLGPVAGLIAERFAQAGEPGRAATYADLAADHALSLSAPAEAVAFRRRAFALEPTPLRQLALGRALYRWGLLKDARAAYTGALEEAERAGDAQTAARAALGIGDTYLPAGWIDEVVLWAERSLRFLDVDADPAAHAHAHFLRGAGRLRAGGAALEEAEGDLQEAVRLARAHGLVDVEMVSRFELGNVLAERGDLSAAVAAYEETAELARRAGDPNQQVLALNNLAYHTMLLGDTSVARTNIEAALSIADNYGLRFMREYLFSTRGEIALAEREWAEAETWFNRSLEEAREHNNVAHIAKCRANLALVAMGRGDLDSALILLEEAAELAAPLTARYMQVQIDLWLSELYVARGESTAAGESLRRAEERLAGSHYDRLDEMAKKMRRELGRRQKAPDLRG